MSIHSVLVASDLSPRSDGVVEAGARLAAIHGADLHLVTARTSSRHPGIEIADGGLPSAEADLDLQLLRAVSPHTDAKSCVVVTASAAEAVLTRARQVEADLVVLGRPGRRHGLGAVLPGAASRIVGRAAAPCLVVDGPLPDPLGRVLVGVDVVSDSAGSLANSLAWARSLFAPGEPVAVTVVHVVPELTDALEALGWNDTEATARLLATLTQGAVERLDPAGFEVRHEVRSAPTVVEGLVACAEDADAGITVIGARSRGLLRQMLLGGAACALVRRAPGAVLVAPAQRSPRSPEAWMEKRSMAGPR